MLRPRKIDCYSQFILISALLLSIPFLSFGAIRIGLIFLGCWQLISALLNTRGFIDAGYKKPIMLYWILWAAGGVSILSLWQFESNLSPDAITRRSWITMGAAAFIAGCYLRIYYRLIDLIYLRNELDGLTKSKH